jgi:DNA replicative helicase MCM subunit Mcm2 (Cdc46/Mcm family)
MFHISEAVGQTISSTQKEDVNCIRSHGPDDKVDKAKSGTHVIVTGQMIMQAQQEDVTSIRGYELVDNVSIDGESCLYQKPWGQMIRSAARGRYLYQRPQAR